MGNLSKRSTVYFEPDIHIALRAKAESCHLSMSYLINEAVRVYLTEDYEDLKDCSDRDKEAEVSYDTVLGTLAASGRI